MEWEIEANKFRRFNDNPLYVSKTQKTSFFLLCFKFQRSDRPIKPEGRNFICDTLIQPSQRPCDRDNILGFADLSFKENQYCTEWDLTSLLSTASSFLATVSPFCKGAKWNTFPRLLCSWHGSYELSSPIEMPWEVIGKSVWNRAVSLLLLLLQDYGI